MVNALQLSPCPIFSGIVGIVKGVRGTTGDLDGLLSHSAKVQIEACGHEDSYRNRARAIQGEKTYKPHWFMQPDFKHEIEKKKSYN